MKRDFTDSDVRAARDRLTKISDQEQRIALCFEAGYDGFWLARFLEQRGIECLVMEPASLQVNRKARRVKTDRIDVEKLLHALIAWSRGERHVCSMVVVPSVEEEDLRRSHWERDRAPTPCAATERKRHQLLRLNGIAVGSASILTREVFYRQFANRHQVASYLGVTPSAYDSGESRRSQSISKAGNRLARTVMIQLAWLWIRHQPESELTKWFRRRTEGQSKRMRCVMIVALARILAIIRVPIEQKDSAARPRLIAPAPQAASPVKC
jgi:transposase